MNDRSGEPGFASAAPNPPSQAFDYAWLKGQARKLGGNAYQASQDTLPSAMGKLSYDQFQSLRFRTDHALWAKDGLAFRLQFFHGGRSFIEPVRLYEIVDGQSREIIYDPAMFEFDKHRYAEAMKLSREVLALRGKTLPESHTSIAASLQTVGRCLDQLGDTAGAERSLKESLDLRKKYLPANSWLIANSESVLGEHYVTAGDYWKGEPLLLHAQDVLSERLGMASLRTQGNLRRLVALYEKLGQPTKAATYRALLGAKAS